MSTILELKIAFNFLQSITQLGDLKCNNIIVYDMKFFVHKFKLPTIYNFQ